MGVALLPKGKPSQKISQSIPPYTEDIYINRCRRSVSCITEDPTHPFPHAGGCEAPKAEHPGVEAAPSWGLRLMNSLPQWQPDLTTPFHSSVPLLLHRYCFLCYAALFVTFSHSLIGLRYAFLGSELFLACIKLFCFLSLYRAMLDPRHKLCSCGGILRTTINRP